MNENLPQIKRENVLTKILKWFKVLFNKEKIVIEEPVQESLKLINETEDEIKKRTFKEKLQVENKERILKLQRKLKEKQVEISELTDKELDEMIELYKFQIEDKKIKLGRYRKNKK